jgi:hypothetical protein
MNQSDSEWSVAQILERSDDPRGKTCLDPLLLGIGKLDPIAWFQSSYKLIVQARSPCRPSKGGGRDG